MKKIPHNSLTNVVQQMGGSDNQLAAAHVIDEMRMGTTLPDASPTSGPNDIVQDTVRGWRGPWFVEAMELNEDPLRILQRLPYQRSEAHLVLLCYATVEADRLLAQLETNGLTRSEQPMERHAWLVANLAQFYLNRMPGNGLAHRLSELAVELYNITMKPELPLLSAQERRELLAEHVVWDTFYDELAPLTVLEHSRTVADPDSNKAWASDLALKQFNDWRS